MFFMQVTWVPDLLRCPYLRFLVLLLNNNSAVGVAHGVNAIKLGTCNRYFSCCKNWDGNRPLE